MSSWSPATHRNGVNLNGDNCGRNGHILSENGEQLTSQNDGNESLYLHGLKQLV